MASSYLSNYQKYLQSITSEAPSRVDRQVSIGTPPAQNFQSGMASWAQGSPNDLKKAKTGRSYRSGSSGGTSSSSRSVSTTKFNEALKPDMPDLPQFEAPRVNKREVRALAQKAAAPGVRKLRESVQMAMGKNYENPNVRRMTLREALQGYGTGLEQVMSGASRQARQEHQQDLNLQAQENMTNYQGKYNALMREYDNSWRQYMASAEKVTSSESGSETSEPKYRYVRGPMGMGLSRELIE